MTIKQIEEMEELYRQSLAVAEAGLKKCAKWREGLTNGTRKAPKISQADQRKIDLIIARQRANFRKKYGISK